MAALIGLLLGGCHGCSSTTAEPSDSTEAGADAPTDAPSLFDLSRDMSSGDRDVEVPLPDGVPPGWDLFPEFSPACRFYVPGEKGEMPAPLEWEPCPGTYPQGLECQKVKQTWKKTPEGSIENFSFTFFDTDPMSGKPLLAFSRFALWNRNDLSDQIVAEADGPIRFSIMQASKLRAGCDFMMKDLHDGRVSVHLYGDDPSDKNPFISNGNFEGTPEAIVADSIDSRRPQIAWRGELARISHNRIT